MAMRVFGNVEQAVHRVACKKPRANICRDIYDQPDNTTNHRGHRAGEWADTHGEAALSFGNK